MARPNLSQLTCDSRLAEETPAYAGPRSLMLRMMLDASRRMGRTGYPRLNLGSMRDDMKRDLGCADRSIPHHEQ